MNKFLHIVCISGSHLFAYGTVGIMKNDKWKMNHMNYIQLHCVCWRLCWGQSISIQDCHRAWNGRYYGFLSILYTQHWWNLALTTLFGDPLLLAFDMERKHYTFNLLCQCILISSPGLTSPISVGLIWHMMHHICYYFKNSCIEISKFIIIPQEHWMWNNVGYLL